MSHYAAGTRFEHKTRDDLIANGYEVVRAAGSKGSTKADLIALKPGQLLLIQCKRAGALPPAEWDRLVEVADWVGALPILAANGFAGRGVIYTRLLGPKRRGCRTQPCEPFLVDELAPTINVAHYAELLHEAAHGGGSCMCDEQPLVRKQFDRSTEVLLTALAGDGLLSRPVATTPPPVVRHGDERLLPVPVATVTLPGVA